MIKEASIRNRDGVHETGDEEMLTLLRLQVIAQRVGDLHVPYGVKLGGQAGIR